MAAKKETKKQEKQKEKPKEHELVPKHEIMKEKDVEDLLKKYGIRKAQLPKILKKDPALRSLEIERGEVIRIIRDSPTAIKSEYYRVVI